MKTPLKIAFKDTEASEFAEAHIRKRVDRLGRFHQRIVGCRVVVEVPHRSPGSGKAPIEIGVEVEVPGRTLVARSIEEPRESKGGRINAINRAFDAMERQLEDDAQIKRGQVKQHEGGSDTGRIVRLFPEQGYGFVEVLNSPDLYFSREVVANSDFDSLEVGMMVKVSRAATDGAMGPQASSIQPIGGQTRA